jgi:molybdopterin synthase sulfur carrier subunit
MQVRVRYFASLRDAAGRDEETVDVARGDLATLYDALRGCHRFALERERVRVAVNGEVVPWTHVPQDGDEVVFIPPVSGG